MDGPNRATTAWRQPDAPPSDALLEEIASRFRLLGEPMRLKILSALSQGERSVGELVEQLGAKQSNVSKHLQAMADEGLLRRRRVGTTIIYMIDDPTILNLCDVVCGGVRARITERARMFEGE